jgi:hypothetical protein
MRPYLPVLLMGLLLPACRETRGAPARDEPGGGDSTAAATVPVIVEPTVVAFWIRATDTLPAKVAREIEAEFRRTASGVARYLADTDVRFVRVESDTVIVQLAGGVQRTIMLSGLDFPYGFLLVDPGYAEEFHTGLDLLEDLEDAVADYFGLDDDQRTPRPRHRIAIALHHLPPGRLAARLAA